MTDMYIIRNEIDNDPDARGYAGMGTFPDYALIAADMNIARLNKNKQIMSGDEVFDTTNSAEWLALTDLNKQLWMSFCGRTEIDPFRAANVALVQNLFGGGSNTVSNLQTARVDVVSFAKFHGFNTINAGMVQAALDLPAKP